MAVASKARKSSKRSKGKAVRAVVRMVKRTFRADEYRSRTATGFNRMRREDAVHVSRRLPDPAPCGQPEYVAAWLIRKVVAA